MRHIRSHVLHGLIAGLAGGIVVVSWFFVVDLIAGQLFRTPVLLARALFDLDAGDGVAAIAGPTLALEYTVIHFTVFAFLGALMGGFLTAVHLAPTVLIGAAFGLGVLSGVYYLVLLINGSNLLQVLPAAHVLGANLLGGVAATAYLHRATHSGADFGPEVLRHHRLVTEGLITGLFGAISVAVWFLLFDAVTRQPFFTPAALGSFLFRGAASPEDVRISFGVVAGYTMVHLLGFSLVGILFAWSAERLQRMPSMWLIWLLAFIVAEGVFLGTVGTSGEWVLGTIGWWGLGVGNVVGVAAMALRVSMTHPVLGERIRNAVNVRV